MGRISAPLPARSSMEGYGLFVTQVCRDNGMAYHHGEGTIAVGIHLLCGCFGVVPAQIRRAPGPE